MARVASPRTADAYPDRDLDCQMAAEDGFQELVANIVAAGWGAEEVADAIGELAKNHRLALDEVAATEAEIHIAHKKSP